MDIRKIEPLWSHIYWLGILDDTGSYTAAAQRLGVSKAAMSQRIQELEKALGIMLVQRTTRSVRLTEAGQAMVALTRPAFAEIETGCEKIRELAEQPKGVIRVTAPVALARQQIVPRLADFMRIYPEIKIEIELSDHISTLAQEGFDLAIRHTSAVPETYVAWVLCQTQTLLLASPEYIQNHGMPSHPSDLKKHNCLTYLRSGSRPTWHFERRKGAGERVSVPVNGSFSANNSETLRELLLAHQGIAAIPDFSVAAELRKETLVQVLPQWKPVSVFGESIYALRPYSPHVPNIIRLFVSYLKVAFENESFI
ncbi:LysR family transcriptional regulator [Advenella alkanexedens]|uniref:LysR family transcriptional regulator n=1 Tax=uncultured bacterium IN-01 TaxID=1805579 RepID=A0A142BVF6_9BACT|nr:LysR family transcriptional regulator [Advenella alkanexedens]AMP42094.1 LysR family transcriptional regulator [uncultured bacterium IN-01]WKU19235.1 LysR substrate-binding domain-containing protein [Advenella alkanexedens]